VEATGVTIASVVVALTVLVLQGLGLRRKTQDSYVDGLERQVKTYEGHIEAMEKDIEQLKAGLKRCEDEKTGFQREIWNLWAEIRDLKSKEG
jgi:peptidoglycan hydrolase CwlO-like protein